MIEQLDFLVRMAAIGAALMLLALVAAGEIRNSIKLPMVGMIVGSIGYLINSTPLMTSAGPMDPWIDLVSISATFWIWLFARRLFEREPERRILLGAAVILLFGWFIGNFLPSTQPIGFYGLHIVSLALIVDLVRIGVLERDDDLVEQRRVIRLWLPLMVAAQAGGILLFETITALSGTDRIYPLVQLTNSTLIFVITVFAGMALLRTEPELLLEPEDDLERDGIEQLDLSPSETVLHDKLKAAMEDGFYRTPGLTIAGLSDHLDTPEHRLRGLINQRLGHRNFSAFLNRYRIAEAREKLADREAVDLPVLTIAMDLGYNSLPTFNRAFKSETGTTPSEYRKESISHGQTTEIRVEAAIQN